jgi:hypothetical protein
MADFYILCRTSIWALERGHADDEKVGSGYKSKGFLATVLSFDRLQCVNTRIRDTAGFLCFPVVF